MSLVSEFCYNVAYPVCEPNSTFLYWAVKYYVE